MPIIHDAIYTAAEDKDHAGNPLIEALPAPREHKQWLELLMQRPAYSENDRLGSESVRMDRLQSILRFHQPGRREIEIAFKIDKCIRWGYVGRNPYLPEYAMKYAAVGSPDQYSLPSYQPKTYGFSILGLSGIGKSTAVEMILSGYPQVIRHTRYQGQHFLAHQVPWIKLDMPADGSIKGFCLSYFRRLDALLQTDYADKLSRRRATMDFMVNAMETTVLTHNVGIIVVDELQNLVGLPRNQAELVLNFLVTIVNVLGIPIITIGTPKALALYQSELQQAKRGSGQGNVFWDRMENGQDWNRFLRSMWPYQYTRDSVPLTDQMAEAFYMESQGIPFIAVNLYKLVQEQAILDKAETFSVRDVHKTASSELKLTEPMRRALQAGRDVDLHHFLDIRPISEKYCVTDQEYGIQQDDPVPQDMHEQKETVIEKAVRIVCMLGFTPGDAQKAVLRVYSRQNSRIEAEELARHSVLLLMQENSSQDTDKESHLEQLCGYDNLKNAGLIDEKAG